MSYINGSDLLVKVGEKSIGHCTSHTVSYSAETKDRAVKPAASVTSTTAGLWKDKAVTSLSVSVQAEGLRVYGETEMGMADLLAAYKAGSPVTITAFARSKSSVPYMTGSFVISSLEESSPAGDDATFSVTFDNTGEVTLTPSAVDAAAE